MGTIIDGLIVFIRKVIQVGREGWAKLTGTDRIVTVVAASVVGFSLVFTGGLLYSGAVFAVSMMVSLGLLAVMVPPLLKWLARYRVVVDFITAIGTLVLGFLSGSATLVVGLVLFGLCMTAGLRIAKGAEHLLPADWNWSYIFPSRWVRMFDTKGAAVDRKPVVIETSAIETKALPGSQSHV